MQKFYFTTMRDKEIGMSGKLGVRGFRTLKGDSHWINLQPKREGEIERETGEGGQIDRQAE